jgi:hypothetical protein
VSPPALAAGIVDITVTAPGGTSVTGPADHFTYLAPAVTKIVPNGGATGGGTSVTITGLFFSGATGVQFGGNAAATYHVVSATTITAVSPPGAPGTVDVQVTTPSATTTATAADHFTYRLPSVSKLTPSSGSGVGGVAVTITGANFTGATQVYFGNTPAQSFTVVSPNRITATSPQAPIGASSLTVTTPYGASAVTAYAKYTATAVGCPVPVSGNWTGNFTSTALATSGTWGGPITFKASKIAGVWTMTGSVDANSSPVGTITGSQVSCNTLTVRAGPWVLDGTVDANGLSTSGNDVGNVNGSALVTPKVTAVSPSTGSSSGADSVTVTGTALGDATAVDFGPNAGTITASSNTSLTVTSPAGAAGTVDVTVNSTDPEGDAATSPISSADQFTYANIPAAVTAISPNAGPRGGGTTVTINGSGFAGTTAVDFGDIPAASFVVESDNTILAVSSRADLLAGNAPSSGDVTVTTPVNTSPTASADVWTWVDPNWPSSISVTASYQGNPSPSLYAWDDSYSYSFTLVPSNSCSADGNCMFELQEGSWTGTYQAYTGGTYCVPAGPDTIAPPYTADHVDHAEMHLNLNGWVADGTYQFYGDYFYDTEGPYLDVPGGCGTSDATNVEEHAGFSDVDPPRWVPGMSQMVLPIPPNAPGDIGGSVTYNFNYANTASVPTISGISLNSGSVAGGNTVTISGAGFTGATEAWFCPPFTGSCTSTPIVVDSDNQVTVVVPSAASNGEAAGPVDVAITGPQGTSLTRPGDVYTYTP